MDEKTLVIRRRFNPHSTHLSVMGNSGGEIVPAHEFEITEEAADDFESGFHIRVGVGLDSSFTH